MAKPTPSDSTKASELVPVFMPTLATLLAQAEVSKGDRLMEAEVLRIPEEAICIMMPPEKAEKLVESRGYRDVEPENCWADWHRLRVQLTGKGYLPKIILCILGDANLESRSRELLKSENIEFEWRESDNRMLAAFQASACRFDPTLTNCDLESIKKHVRVLYVLSKNFTADEASSFARSFLPLGNRLLDMGDLAMKCESSGITHGRTRWLELGNESDSDDFWLALFRAYAQMPIQSGDDYYSCGMHLLGHPDLIVSNTCSRKNTNRPKTSRGQPLIFFMPLLITCL